MSYKPTHAKPGSLVKFAARGGVIAGAAAIAAASAGALAPGVANAATTTPTQLQLTLGAQASSDTGGVLGNGTSAYGAGGSVTLAVGNANGANSAAAEVDLSSTTSTAPATPPSFTASAYDAGAPRWVIELENGNYLEGYPAQLPEAGANAAFTGDQWSAVGGNGSSLDSHGVYETYSEALTDAGDSLSNVSVTSAYIVDDDASTGTDTISGIQYDGQSPSSTEVPALTSGETASAAATAIRNAGFVFGTHGVAADDVVTAESPAASTYAATGSTVTITASAPAPTYTASEVSEGKIQNAGSGKYLNVDGGDYAAGGKLIQYDASGASNETFQLVEIKNGSGTVAGEYLQAEDPTTHDWYYVVASGTGQLTLGTAVQHPDTASLTTVLSSGEDLLKSGSYYEFQNDAMDVMDVKGASTANGAVVDAWAKNGGTNQQWSLP